eukprot:1257783-Prymnesium_polylepis.1
MMVPSNARHVACVVDGSTMAQLPPRITFPRVWCACGAARRSSTRSLPSATAKSPNSALSSSRQVATCATGRYRSTCASEVCSPALSWTLLYYVALPIIPASAALLRSTNVFRAQVAADARFL